MSHSPQRPSNNNSSNWFYLGASGILQPLSEEFLYRAAQNRGRHTCRWCEQHEHKRRDADA